MRRIISKKWFKNIITTSPLVILLVITISTNYCFFVDDTYYLIYDILSYLFGTSIVTLCSLLFIVYKYNFCTYSILATWGIIIYTFLNLISTFIECLFKYNLSSEILFFEITILSIISSMSLYYFIKKEKR